MASIFSPLAVFFQPRPIFISGVIPEVQKREVQGRNSVQISKLDDSQLLSSEKFKEKKKTGNHKHFKYLYSNDFLTFLVTTLQNRGPSEDPFCSWSSFFPWIRLRLYPMVNVHSNTRYHRNHYSSPAAQMVWKTQLLHTKTHWLSNIFYTECCRRGCFSLLQYEWHQLRKARIHFQVPPSQQHLP